MNKVVTKSELYLENTRKNIHSALKISKLKSVLMLTCIYFVVQIIVALYTRSLALLSDAGHMLADVGGLALVLFAINYSQKPATLQHTYGFYRVEILAALLNSVVLILISVYILYEGYRRIFEPPEIQGLPMIIVAAVGLGVNYAGFRLLGNSTHTYEESQADTDKEHEDINVKSAYMEVLNDIIGSVGVITAGLIILTTRLYIADPLISIGLGLFILPRTWSLMKKSIHILMEGVPSNISPEDVKNSILEIKGVTGVFDLHIWTITSGMNALSGHVVVIDGVRSQTILQEINAILEKKFKINHATIQIESYHSEPD
jgi:cobalt-zinc-cadmium efflux system protein